MSDSEFVVFEELFCIEFYEVIEKFEDVLIEVLIELLCWKCELLEKLCNFKKLIVEFVIKLFFKVFEYKYVMYIGVFCYLKDICEEIIDVVLEWFDDDDNDENKEDFDCKGMFIDFFVLNILVEYKEGDVVFVVYELNLIFGNIFGKIEYVML